MRMWWRRLALAGALLAGIGTQSGCGTADGADPIKGTTSGTTAAGGGNTTASGGFGGAGGGIVAGGGQPTGGSGGSGGIPVFVPDPFQTPATAVDTWSGKLPPGGLFDNGVKVYFPKSTPAGTTYPLVVFAHSPSVGDDDYSDTFTHLAKFGYVVATVEYDWNELNEDHHAPADSLSKAITLLTTDPPNDVGDIVDADKIAAMGHGLGGKSAIWLALEGDEVDALVALDPIDDQLGLLPSAQRPSLTPEMMSTMAVPALYLATEFGPAGLTECVPGASNGCRFYEATPAGVPAWLMVLEDFGHLQFVDNYGCLACYLCYKGSESEHAAVQVVARGLVVAFLEYTLKGEAGYLSYLQGVEFEDLRTKGRLLDAQEQFEFCAEQ